MINNTKIIIPTRIEWLSLLAVVGIFGFLAQVKGFEVDHFVTLRANDIQILLTMGLQRETASRGTLALYSRIIFATLLERILFHTLPSYLCVWHFDDCRLCALHCCAFSPASYHHSLKNDF